jgi:pimeloyl-ACP methyl ester carboxylesterase
LQWPFAAERFLTRDDSRVRGYLTGWASPFGDWPSEQDVERYAAAMALPFVAHSAAEYYRWIGRNQLRLDGPTFLRRVGEPIYVPVLHLQGSEDGCVLARPTLGSDRFVRGRYTHEVLDGVGHFLAEEAPERVNSTLLDWLTTVPTEPTQPNPRG